MKSLTIAFLTARKEPQAHWCFESIIPQVSAGDKINFLVINTFGEETSTVIEGAQIPVSSHFVKPNIWQGAYRFPSGQWWAKAAALNTAICLCKGEWLAVVDDRSVVMPNWLQSVRDAMTGKYAVCGSYEKRRNMVVENGIIKFGGTTTGIDPRQRGINKPVRCRGQWWFGCTNALPLEWALKVNGYDESADSLGMEDVIFGEMLERNDLQIRYDERMRIVEDRTPEQSDSLVRRKDKGVSPNDKSHALLARVAGKTQATHNFDLRQLRDSIQRGEQFPIPTEPLLDWYDNEPIQDFK